MNDQKKKPIVKTRVEIVRQVLEDGPKHTTGDSFHKMSQSLSNKLGSPYAFLIAISIVVLWGSTGPFFNFSDTWQLIINTSTTIVTFLMVFAIQNTQNRDSKAMQLKLNELIKSSRSARTEFVDVEDLTDSELESLHGQFKDLHEKLNDKIKD